MLQDIKKASTQSLIYSLGNIGIKVIGLILIPYYTNERFLSHYDFGALALLEATMQLIAAVLAMSIAQGLMRWYWDKDFIDKQKSIFFTAFSFLFMLLIPVTIALLFFSGDLSKLIFDNLDYRFLLQLTIVTASFKVINSLTLTLLKLRSKSVLYASTQILSLVVSLLIIIGGLYRGHGLMAVWYGNLIGEACMFVVFLYPVIRNMKFTFNGKILQEMLKYGYPLMLTSVAGIVLLTTDRYMLNSRAGLVDTGVYSLGVRIANSLKVVISTSLISGLTPFLMKKIDSSKNQRYYAKVMTYTTFVFIMGLLGLSLFSLEALKIFTNSRIYWESTGIIAIISFSLLFGLMRSNANIGLIVVKDTKTIGVLTLLASVINIFFNYIFIQQWNIYGAAFATLFSQLLFFIATCYYANKKYFIPYEWKRIFVLITMAVFVVVIGYEISYFVLWLRIVIKTVLLISFPFILYFLGFYDKIEIESIKAVIAKMLFRQK